MNDFIQILKEMVRKLKPRLSVPDVVTLLMAITMCYALIRLINHVAR